MAETFDNEDEEVPYAGTMRINFRGHTLPHWRYEFVDGDRARIEGLAMMKRHLKKSAEHPQGTIAEREGSVHISNLMLQSVFDASKRKKATATA